MDEIVITPNERKEDGGYYHVFYVAITANHTKNDASYAFLSRFYDKRDISLIFDHPESGTLL